MSKALKFGIFLLILLCTFLLLLIFVDLPLMEIVSGLIENTETTQVTEIAGEWQEDLVAAVELALVSAPVEDFDYMIDHIQVQDDGLMAIVWLAAVDPETGDVFSREPELALVQKTNDQGWKVMFEGDEKFLETFEDFQYAHKSVEGDWVSDSDSLPKTTRVYGGYYLPWAENLIKRLTWSVGHTSCTPIYYCTHAFDFADGTMFPLVAAKGGTVYHWRDSCANGDPYCTNSITLQDRSTTPWTYQIYLHIAQNSIPLKLKQVGTPVMQGQYIADVDDTGYSTGHHVHFMVVSEDTKFMANSGYVWGVAEDITFRDVFINWDVATQGGRPRLEYEAATYGGEGQTYYESGNTPANPPTGALTAPANNTYVTGSLQVSGWGKDDIAVTKMEILANYGGDWVRIGNEQTANPFSTSIDLCQTTIPDGPFSLALRVWDYEGNPSGLLSKRNLIKDVVCGASGTEPQIALTLNGGVLALPQNGFVSADVTKGSTGSAIVSVEFWLRGQDWSKDTWVKLGKDTNGSNGWQAPISTVSLPEGDDYTIMAVVTDSLGSQDLAMNMHAIVDHTPPQVVFNSIPSPVMGDSVNLTWSAEDTLAGMDFYSLAVSVNTEPYQPIADDLSSAVRSHTYPVEKNNVYIFALTATDKSGNPYVVKMAMHTDGYVFPYQFIFPLIQGGD